MEPEPEQQNLIEKMTELPYDKSWMIQGMAFRPVGMQRLDADGVVATPGQMCGVIMDGIPMGQHPAGDYRSELIGLILVTECMGDLSLRLMTFAHYLHRHFGDDGFREEFWKMIRQEPATLKSLEWLWEAGVAQGLVGPQPADPFAEQPMHIVQCPDCHTVTVGGPSGECGLVAGPETAADGPNAPGVTE